MFPFSQHITTTAPSNMIVAGTSTAASRSQHRRRHSFHHVKDSCASKKKEDAKSPHGTAGPSNTSKKANTNSPKDSTHFKWILWASFILTVNAGFINTITLHTLHAMPSAHVTGIVARASNFVANGQGWEFLEYLVSYVCFVVGACTGGCLINYETFYLGRMYGRALFILAAIQGCALIIENSYDNSIIFTWMCTFSCGLQNSMTSKYSGNAVRTTHLTGASTDMGIALGHILKGRQEEWWKVQMHGIAVVGFFIGGVLGFFAFEKFEHAALLVNVCLTTCCAVIHVLYVAYHERMPVISVLESRSDIRIHKHRRQLSDPQHSRTLPRSPRLRVTPKPKRLDIISTPLRLNMTPRSDVPVSSPPASLLSTAPSTGHTADSERVTPSAAERAETEMQVVPAVVAAAEGECTVEPAAEEATDGVEEEPDNDDVWGHTPASSVHGLDDDDNEVEPTPEEDPYPLFAEDDIAGLPQEESEIGSVVCEAGRGFPRDEEEGGGAEVRPEGCLPRAFSPTGSGRIWSPRSLRRHRGQQQDRQQWGQQQEQDQQRPRGEDAGEDEGKN